MLAKKNRIRLNKEFDRVFKSGHSFYGKILGIKVVDNKFNYNRFGIMIGLKISKKAVVRNLIRRRIRAVARKNNEKLVVGKDIVIMALPTIRDKDFLEIKSALEASFSKLSLYERQTK